MKQFRPIRTNVGGMDVCEHLPLHAKMADKLAIVRYLVFGNSFHNRVSPTNGNRWGFSSRRNLVASASDSR